MAGAIAFDPEAVLAGGVFESYFSAHFRVELCAGCLGRPDWEKRCGLLFSFSSSGAVEASFAALNLLLIDAFSFL